MKRYRPQTPREILARDHNWHMGRFRRLLAASSMFKDEIRQNQFESLIHEEMHERQKQYEKERDEL